MQCRLVLTPQVDVAFSDGCDTRNNQNRGKEATGEGKTHPSRNQ
jgi:hypothetical protein